MKWTLRQKITLISLFIICTVLAIYGLRNNDILQAKSPPSFAPTNTMPPTQNSLIIPLTRDAGSIIMPPTAVIDPANSALPTQNGLLASPTPDGTPIATSTTDDSYNPAYWGLPAQIGGYEIMVVVSSENQACSPPNQLQLVLHAIPNQPQTLTSADIQQLETVAHRSISLMFSSGVVSIEQVQTQMASWNAGMVGGCINLGGPIPSPTPNPDDPISMTSYDPAYWGFPEAIAGYKVLVIKSVESSKCVPNAVIQVVLQMSQSEVDRLTKTTYDTIMGELDKFHWNIDQWLIGHVEPGTSKENLVSVCAPNLNRDELR